MTVWNWVGLVGVAFELGGLLLTAWDLGHAEESLVPGTWRSRRRRAENSARRLIGLKPLSQTVPVGTALEMSYSVGFGGARTHRPSPADDAPAREWIEWLRWRIEDVDDEARARSDSLLKGLEETRKHQEAIAEQLRDEQRAAEQRDRERALRSIHISWRGLGLFAAGVVLSGAASVLT